MAIFMLFFGIGLIDTVRGGEWVRALFWVAVGAAFSILERRPLRRGP